VPVERTPLLTKEGLGVVELTVRKVNYIIAIRLCANSLYSLHSRYYGANILKPAWAKCLSKVNTSVIPISRITTKEMQSTSPQVLSR